MSESNTRLTNLIQEKVTPIAVKIGNQKYLAAIRDGMTSIIPLTIIGGFSVLLASPPVPTGLKATNFFYSFLLSWQSWATANSNILTIPYDLTIGLLAPYVLVAITYYLTKRYKMNMITNLISVLYIFFIVASPTTTIKSVEYLPQTDLSAQGMFGAMVIAIVVIEINRFFIKNKLVIKLPSSVPEGVAAPFEVLTPMITSTILFVILNAISIKYTKSYLVGIIYLLFKPFTNVSDTLPVILLLAIIAQTLWFFGIHGDNMIGSIVTPITTLNIALNLKQYQSGHAMTHIFAGSFYTVWGGWIIYPAFLLAMILFAKSARLHSLSKLAPPGTIFNINEPLVFGIPTVLNPYFYIPGTICIIINLTAAYLLTSLGILGKFYIYAPWTTPGIIQVFISSMDWKNIVLWIILFIIDLVVAIPFVRMYDHQLQKEEQVIKN
ncbi:PTS transporter subunit EIIC [Ligilactobacillus sp. WILCCON 0076]|uniref:Permease IIC component n=1 Tax=Ligilactobacillus ubinensis TaxID=2876789 RepID=A0A9X2JMD6_9LACO|nr:PTS transporter subunit EIIC [Ligilactobacillus ubinensis]MCP0887967.1 PTS transporter subunit EIIC [Ligilactobacillus ubinensis]